MFAELSDRLSTVLSRLTGRGVLTEESVPDGLDELPVALLDADGGFDVARAFPDRGAEKGVGPPALKPVAPGQQLVKMVYEELTALLGEKQQPMGFASVPPTVVLLVAPRGWGKTTTAAKLAK